MCSRVSFIPSLRPDWDLTIIMSTHARFLTFQEARSDKFWETSHQDKSYDSQYDTGLVWANIPISHRMSHRASPVMLISVGSQLSVSWLRLWYGVFSEHGYPGDNLYPGQESSCGAADWWRVCPKHKHYDRTSKTKQNLLCDGHSAREVIQQQHKAKQQQQPISWCATILLNSSLSVSKPGFRSFATPW